MAADKLSRKKQCTLTWALWLDNTTFRRNCKSLAVNPSSHHYPGRMNGPMNPFSFVLLTISLILFGLFMPCFPLQKALALLTHAGAHSGTPTLFEIGSVFCHCAFSHGFSRAFHGRFVATTSNSLNFFFLPIFVRSMVQWARLLRGQRKMSLEHFGNAYIEERTLRVSGA